MSKYIDAEKLKRFVESIGLTPQKSADYNDGRDDAKRMVLDFIDSLQREQLEQQEVDLEKEIIDYFQGMWPGTETAEQCNTDMHFTPLAITRMVKHFYELRLKARKEE